PCAPASKFCEDCPISGRAAGGGFGVGTLRFRGLGFRALRVGTLGIAAFGITGFGASLLGLALRVAGCAVPVLGVAALRRVHGALLRVVGDVPGSALELNRRRRHELVDLPRAAIRAFLDER